MATQHHHIPYTRWSKPRSCFNHDGTPKRRYATQEEAEHRARKIEETRCVAMTAYRCPLGHWHVAHDWREG